MPHEDTGGLCLPDMQRRVADPNGNLLLEVELSAVTPDDNYLEAG